MPKNSPPLPGKVRPPQAISARSFVDFEYELDPRAIEHKKQMVSMFLHAQLGDIEEALQVGTSDASRNAKRRSVKPGGVPRQPRRHGRGDEAGRELRDRPKGD